MRKNVMIMMAMAVSLCSASAGFSQNLVSMEAPLILPNTTEEMQHPEFWIDRLDNPDKVIMTPEQIAAMNRNRPTVIEDIDGDPFSIEKTVNYKDRSIGAMYLTVDPLTITSFRGDSLRARFINHKQLFNRDLYDRRKVKYSDHVKNIIFDRMNEDRIPETIIPRYGLIVKRTLNRAMPMNEAAYPGENGWLDYIQSTGLETGMPVAALHMSKDKDWYYVRSEISFGWVPAQHVAFAVPEAIHDYSETRDFIVPIDHKVPVYADPELSVFLSDIFMGARLKLMRHSVDGYAIDLPVRLSDGSLDFVTGYVRPDAPMSIGYQKYTRRNIITTMFRLLNRPLGWADSDYERDCCGSIRAVHKTFGIISGRWVTYILHATDHVHAFPADTPVERKYDILDSCESGICVIGNEWHIMMYLGKVNDKYYVIQQNGLDYKTEDGTTMQVRRVCVNETESGPHFPAAMWTEISEIKP